MRRTSGDIATHQVDVAQLRGRLISVQMISRLRKRSVQIARHDWCTGLAIGDQKRVALVPGPIALFRRQTRQFLA
jgi:hypothetical protein